MTTPPSGGEVDGSLVERKDKSVAATPAKEFKVTRASARIAIEPWRIAEDPKAHREGKCGRKEKCSACRLIYSLVEMQGRTTSATNTILRQMWLQDGLALDKMRLAENRLPRNKDKEWPSQTVNYYQEIRKHYPEISGAIASLLARRTYMNWAQKRFGALVKEDESPPHWKKSMPFPIRADGVRVTATKEKDLYMFSFSLHAGRHGGAEFRLPLTARDEHHRSILGAMDLGSVKVGDAMIQRDRRRASKWYVRFAYTRRVKASNSTRMAAINKGMCCMLAAISSDGRPWLYEAQDIAAYLKRVQSARKSYQYASKGSNRWGHGRKRTIRPIERLTGQGERWRETKCQVIARRFVDWLIKEKIGRLVIEDFTGIRDGDPEQLLGGKHVWDLLQEWPYFKLQSKIISCAEEAGITVIKVSAKFISQTCPKCGHTDEKNMQVGRRKFSCVKCKYRRHLDLAAAQNVLARGKGDTKGGGNGVSAAGKGKSNGARKPTTRKGGGNGAKPGRKK